MLRELEEIRMQVPEEKTSVYASLRWYSDVLSKYA